MGIRALIIFLILSSFAYGADSTVTVAPSGEDYTTVEAALDANEMDIPSVLGADSDFIVQITGDWSSTTDATAVTVNGYTTDSNGRVIIQTDSGSRHDGKWDTTAYKLVASVAFGRVIEITDEDVDILGLQIQNSATFVSNNPSGIGYNGVSGILTIAYCIIRGDSASIASANASDEGILFLPAAGGVIANVYNNVIYDWGNGFEGNYTNAIGGTFYNNTISDCAINGIDLLGGADVVNMHVKNNIIQGSGTEDIYDGADGSPRYHSDETNLTSDATSTQSGLRNINLTFVDESNNDFHLASGDTDAIDGGTDLSGSFIDSITVRIVDVPDHWTNVGGADKVASVTDGTDGNYINEVNADSSQRFLLVDPGADILIDSVKLEGRMQKTGASTVTIALVDSSNGTVRDGTSNSMTTSWAAYNEVYTTRPGGGPFTLANLDEIAIGVKAPALPGLHNARCTKLDFIAYMSAAFLDDVDGVTRGATWDIGFDEFVAAAAVSDRRRLQIIRSD